MYDEYRKDHPTTLTDQEVLEAVGENKQEDMPKHSKSGIVVKGLYDVAVHFSKCCSPVPGDEIVGFVTRGRGGQFDRNQDKRSAHEGRLPEESSTKPPQSPTDQLLETQSFGVPR